MSNALTRWDPFKEIEDLQGRLADLFGRPLVRRGAGKEEGLAMGEWAPLVDILEDEKEYLIKAELPEVRREDVKVSLQDDMLSIAGERLFQKEEKSRKCHRVERAYGAFSRSFTLPRNVDVQKVSAEFKDGVLRVRLPKTEAARAKQIEIKVG